MSRIAEIQAREILDSRGLPTVEVDIRVDDGAWGRASVPSGASTGTAEALELRDDDANRYDGRGVSRAVENVRSAIGPALVGHAVEDQLTLDARLIELDGTENKSRLGANALLGVSLAAAHAAAASRDVPLYRHLHELTTQLFQADEGDLCRQLAIPAPTMHRVSRSPATTFGPRLPLPMTNMISGGLHAGGNLDFQDVLILPVGAPNYRTGLEWIVRVYRRLGELLKASGYEGRLVGDEGGFGPRLPDNDSAIEMVTRAIEAARLRPGADVAIALDVASTHFYDGSHYRLAATGDARLTNQEMIEQLVALVDRYPIVSIEDGLAEEDWSGWQELTRRLGDRVRLVGDDLFATNPRRVRRGIGEQTANAVLIKVNQIGTLAETLYTMRIAQEAGYTRVVSARSGETEDTTIADLAVGAAGEQIKIGSIVRSERLVKYNRLLRIAEELGE
ncbi:MAG: phosphopyruvate hydratase [Pirellulales bacterium]|nr:phosphopyruvate hydratase [Pirellulales bacterium]